MLYFRIRYLTHLVVIGGLVSFVANAEFGGKSNGIKYVSEYKFEKQTRLYYPASGSKDQFKFWGSIKVLKGMTLKGIYWIRPFRDGVEYSEAGEGEESPTLEITKLAKNGEKHLLVIEPSWRRADKKYAEMSDRELHGWAESGVMHGGTIPIIKKGDFKFPGAQGYYGILKSGNQPHSGQYWKSINVYSREFLASITYFERDPASGDALEPAKWSFDDVADEVMKSFRFEKLLENAK